MKNKVKVTLCENTFEPSTWKDYEVDDVREFLVEHFGIWPDNAHIYLDHVANNADITPHDEAGIERLGKVQGHLYVVVYPEGLELILIIVAIALAAVTLALTFLFRPSAKNQQEQSPNNRLADRQNQARPNERIPDIFGQLWTTFDLLAVPYKTFVANQEIEHCYMCIGRGDYDIAMLGSDLAIRDDVTPLGQIDGCNAQLYGPFNSPNKSTPPPGGGPIGAVNVTGAGLYLDPSHILWSISGGGGSGFTASFDHVIWVFDPGGDNEQIYYKVTMGHVVTPGSGYTSAPTITFTPHSGDFVAHAVAVVEGTGAKGTIGNAFSELVVNLNAFGCVNGQVLTAPNLNSIIGDGDIRFKSPNIIENDGSWDFTHYFSTTETMSIGGLRTDDDLAVDPGGVHASVHLGGTGYTISSVSSTQIVLSSPGAINSNWSALAAFTGGVSKYGNIDIISDGQFEIGPFAIIRPEMTEIWLNFVCDGGLYLIDKDGNQHSVTVNIQAVINPCDANGNLITGDQRIYTTSVVGSTSDRQTKGTTLKITLPTTGLYAANAGILIACGRTSNTDLTAGRTAVDETKWRDCFLVSPVGAIDFGNVTTIQTQIVTTPTSAAIKTRKMNALVTRKVPQLVSGVFTGLTASKNAADILCAMALDPFIGNRTLAELDVSGIYAAIGTGGTSQGYFNVGGYLTAPIEFCYTFDDSKQSFEEAVAALAQAVFCVAFRRGSVLSVSFEQLSNLSVLLFNHRNKVPKTEVRTVTFGTENDNDGIELDYIEPSAPNYPNMDTLTTLHFPPDQSASNPKKVTAIGVRNLQQATLLGWRLYNKLIYQSISVQFEATEETALLVLHDRILVADNTRPDTQDGEIIAQASLLLTCSQNVVFGSFNYSIFLQLPDGSVENIPITAGPNPNQVILAFAPTIACVIDPDKYARTTYIVVSDAPTRKTPFLLTEKAAKDGKLYEVKAVNYDENYYAHDGDYIT